MKKTILTLLAGALLFATSCKKEEPITPPTNNEPPIGDTTDTNQVIIDEYKLVLQVYDNSYTSNTSGWLYIYTYSTEFQSYDIVDLPSTSSQQTGYGDLIEYNFEIEQGEDAFIRFYFESGGNSTSGYDLNDFVDVTVYKNNVQIYYRHGTSGRSDLGPTEIDLLP